MDSDQKLDLIIQRLNEIDSRLNKVEDQMSKLDISVKKMDGHVDFVEAVYDSVKYPFHSLMGMVKWVGPGGEQIESRPEQEMLEFHETSHCNPPRKDHQESMADHL